MLPLPANHEFTPENSKLILDEALVLLEARRRSEPGTTRLNYLLANHFASNDFRSFCCFGHKGDDVSLELFNSLCILPSTDWAVHLVPVSSTIQLAWAESSDIVVEKITAVSQNIFTLLQNILKSHPKSAEIVSFFPRNNELPPGWVLSILGRKNRGANRDFTPPSLEELRRRISLSIDGTLARKSSETTHRFFSKENGLLWQTVDDSFDVNKVYLKVCSEFPKRLEKLLHESGKTLDQLAGVEVVQRYPLVEAVVRDALSRGRIQGMESKDLKLADGSLGGTVFAIHNAHYSVEWISAYLVDTDNNAFMKDVRAATLSEKERLLRITTKACLRSPLVSRSCT
jgi:hypothetical protein